MAPRNKSSVAAVSWTANNSALTWNLLSELAKKENHGALYGVQKGNVSEFCLSLALLSNTDCNITIENHWIHQDKDSQGDHFCPLS